MRGGRSLTRWWLLRLGPALGSALGFAVGCTVTLEHRLACGDGFTDAVAGEECDPRDLASFERACEEREGVLEGRAICDPTTCTIQTSPEICAFCGDGVISGGEECDGDNLRNKKCQSGEDQVTCDPVSCTFDFSECPLCGNGVRDPDEECDWNHEGGDLTEAVLCSSLAPLGDIDDKPYSQGEVPISACSKSCTLSRKPCSFCGDGELDPANTDIGANDVPVIRGAEVCDGGQVDDDALSDFCQMICKLEPGDAPSSLALRCDAICGETCRSFTAPPMDPDPIGAARCCVRGGESCDPTIPCCFDLDNGTMGEGCTLVAVDTPDGTTFVDRCRSI